MAAPSEGQLVPYALVRPGTEAVYTGETSEAAIDAPEWPLQRCTDADGNVYVRWPTWTWQRPPEEGEDWGCPEINALNAMQVALGPLDDETRRLRAHMGSLVPCDNGFPVALDEILCAIGTGRLPGVPFHAGCFMGGMFYDTRGTQPGQVESMRIIRTVVTEYMDGARACDLVHRFPHAAGFIDRMYRWLGPADELTEVQRLLLERMLLPFSFFAKDTEDHALVDAECFGPGGRGARLDARIAQLAGVPPIRRVHEREFREHREAIDDPERRALYGVCCHIASGVHGLSDCHHATFHRIEYWLYGIGTGNSPDGPSPVIPSRRMGAERERLGRLLFGYVLGLDRWLLGVPMQFVLLDLAHLDLGLDPHNEVLRVYACLGDDRAPLKQWLAGSLWFLLANQPMLGNPAGLFERRHRHLVEAAERAGLSLREWMDALLAAPSGASVE